MNFWAQRLAPQQQPAPPPPSNQPWWMTPQQQQQQPQAAPPPVHQPAQPPQQQASVPPSQEVAFGDLLNQGEYTTTKAQSARDTELCPECSSPNYLSPKGHPNAMKQCFNCGYNPRFAHSTAGASGVGQSNVADPRPARVQTLSQNNFNPREIVGRVT